MLDQSGEPLSDATAPQRQPADTSNFPLPTRTLTPAMGVDRLLNTEWLLTNGLGGFAMGTALGAPTRRYHALLTCATKPPLGRILALSAMIETLEITSETPGTPTSPNTPSTQTIDLSTFQFAAHPSPILHPRGDAFLVRFECDLSARWTWEIHLPGERITIRKQVYLFERQNVACVRYAIERESAPAATGPASGSSLLPTPPHRVMLKARPLVPLRDFHAINRRPSAGDYLVTPALDHVDIAHDNLTLRLHSDSMSFSHQPLWWDNVFYAIDASRHQECVEDHFSPGVFMLDLQSYDRTTSAKIQASLVHQGASEKFMEIAPDLIRRRARLGASLAHARQHTGTVATKPSPSDDAILPALIAAADQFVVARRQTAALAPLAPAPASAKSPDDVSTIAGYPWFSDWGRDTFIALPGLMLATGRFDEARKTLLAFITHQRAGLIPNVFNDQTGHAEYNTVDASLWFVHSACEYLKATSDRTTFDSKLAPACLDIISAYRKGTEFNIAMDPMDKLVTAGSHSTQLTWMDASRDGVVFTPRFGKPVEINALWHNALRALAEALAPTGSSASANLLDLANTVARSFRAAFWNPADSSLFDCLVPDEGAGRIPGSGSAGGPGWRPIDEVRPNQLFAISLPHSPLSKIEQQGVLACVKARLLTPKGVRTLDPADPRFRPRYQGTLFERDGAYHQGTAWPWLLGPYAEGVLRVGEFAPAARAEARAALAPILDQLISPTNGEQGACLNQIAEIYDATAPQRPQGCTAQAWSVAEILRVLLLCTK